MQCACRALQHDGQQLSYELACRTCSTVLHERQLPECDLLPFCSTELSLDFISIYSTMCLQCVCMLSPSKVAVHISCFKSVVVTLYSESIRFVPVCTKRKKTIRFCKRQTSVPAVCPWRCSSVLLSRISVLFVVEDGVYDLGHTTSGARNRQDSSHCHR